MCSKLCSVDLSNFLPYNSAIRLVQSNCVIRLHQIHIPNDAAMVHVSLWLLNYLDGCPTFSIHINMSFSFLSTFLVFFYLGVPLTSSIQLDWVVFKPVLTSLKVGRSHLRVLRLLSYLDLFPPLYICIFSVSFLFFHFLLLGGKKKLHIHFFSSADLEIIGGITFFSLISLNVLSICF